MRESEAIEPIKFGAINDPNTGSDDATYFIYPLLELELAIFDDTRKVLESKRDAIAESDNKDERQKHISKMKINSLSLMFEAMKHWYEPAQFTVVGELGAYAVQVSYDRPKETPPEQHHQLNQVVIELAGQDYVTIKRTKYPKKA